MKKFFLLSVFICSALLSFSQDEESDTTEKKGFKKENLFTGGSISLSFGNQTFLIGANPVLGYSVTKWLDLGIVVNYTYSSARDYFSFDDRLRQSVYGGGIFTRIFPIRFLFAQAQLEHNWIKVKYIPAGGAGSTTNNVSGNSVLVGGGYTSGRHPGSGNPYYYLAVLFDVGSDDNSPYTDETNRAIPIIRAGINIPLFQKKSGDRDF